jgi:hypothetical protein
MFQLLNLIPNPNNLSAAILDPNKAVVNVAKPNPSVGFIRLPLDGLPNSYAGATLWAGQHGAGIFGMQKSRGKHVTGQRVD